MKIIQHPRETNDQATILSKGLADLGYDVSRWPGNNGNADILHFHDGLYVGRHLSDFGLNKKKCSEIKIIHYRGKDIRTEQGAVMQNPYIRLGYEFNDDLIQQNLAVLARIFPACIVSNMELAHYAARFHDRVYVLPLAVDLYELDNGAPSVLKADGEPLIIHAPKEGKGTEYVEETLEQLRADGYRFSYERAEGLNREEALGKFRQADILIDQIIRGFYGIVAVEGMALGKPVISYVREDLKYRYPADLPVVSANPANLHKVLAELLDSSSLRKQRGMEGRTYVEKQHALPAVAGMLNEIYQRELRIAKGLEISVPAVINLQSGGMYYYPIDAQSRRIAVHGALSSITSPIQETVLRTITLQPNRMFFKKGFNSRKKKPASYFSFNLAEIPSSLTIINAVLHVPITLKNGKASIFRIKKAWDRTSIRKKRPALYRKPIKRLHVKGKRGIGSYLWLWDCTDLARYWRSEQLINHGVYTAQRLRKTPQLVVTAEETLTPPRLHNKTS